MQRSALDGRVVLVTGAAGRLAERIFPALTRARARTAAVIHHERESERVRAAGAEQVVVGDLAEESFAAACFSTVRAHLGDIYGVVHAAGGWRPTPLHGTSLASWREVIDANLTSTINILREAAAALPAGGRVVTFAAAQGADRGAAGQGAYSAAKAGVVRLVEAAGAELRKQGISVFAIAPSTILYGAESDRPGVSAAALADLCLYLLTLDDPAALSGQVIRAYGTVGP